jgi:CDP-6-deoxy-D-xylo-4-hexulose-3-dehydrase
LGNLPEGYDHKYTYSHLGYNLKISDMQAACALAQLEKAPAFIRARKDNFAFLKERLKICQEFLQLPEATPGSDPSWFGFPITIKDSSKIDRRELMVFLAEKKIGTRLIFAGNLINQPYMKNQNYRISSDLTNTDTIMNNSFWIGCYQGISEEMIDYMVGCFKEFCKK